MKIYGMVIYSSWMSLDRYVSGLGKKLTKEERVTKQVTPQPNKRGERNGRSKNKKIINYLKINTY